MFKGRKMEIYGAFSSKSKAMKCEQSGKGRFILKRRIKGHTRYVVVKEK